MGLAVSSPADRSSSNERSQQISFGLSVGELDSKTLRNTSILQRPSDVSVELSNSALPTVSQMGRRQDLGIKLGDDEGVGGLSYASIRHYFVSLVNQRAVADKTTTETGVGCCPTGLIPKHLKVRHWLFLHYVHSSNVLEDEFVAYFYQNTRRVVIAFCAAAAAAGVYSLTQWIDKIRPAYAILQIFCMMSWAVAVVGMILLKGIQPPLNLMTNQNVMSCAITPGHLDQSGEIPSSASSNGTTLRAPLAAHGSKRWWEKSVSNAKVHEWIVTLVVCANFVFVTSFNGAHGDCSYISAKRRQLDCLEAITFSGVFVYAISINTFFCQVRFLRLLCISLCLSLGFFVIVFVDPLVHWNHMYVVTQDVVMVTSLVVCLVSSWLRERSSRNQFEVYVERHLQAAQLGELKLRRERLLSTDVPLTAVHSGAVQTGGSWDMGPEVYVACVCVDGMAQWSQARGPCDTVELIHRLFELLDSVREAMNSSSTPCGFSLLRFHTFGDRYLVAVEDDGSNIAGEAQLQASKLPANQRLQMVLRFAISCCLGGARVLEQSSDASFWFDYNSALTPREGTHCLSVLPLRMCAGIAVGRAKGFVQKASRNVLLLGPPVDEAIDVTAHLGEDEKSTAQDLPLSSSRRQKASSLLRECLFLGERNKAAVADKISDPVALISFGGSLSKMFAALAQEEFEEIFGVPFASAVRHEALLALPIDDAVGSPASVDGSRFEILFEDMTSPKLHVKSDASLPSDSTFGGIQKWLTVTLALNRTAEQLCSFSFASSSKIPAVAPAEDSMMGVATVQLSGGPIFTEGIPVAEGNSVNSVRRDGMSSLGSTRQRSVAKGALVSFDLSKEDLKETPSAAVSMLQTTTFRGDNREEPVVRAPPSAYQHRQLRLIAAQRFTEAIRLERASFSAFQIFAFPPTEALYRWASTEHISSEEIVWGGVSMAAVLGSLLAICGVYKLVASSAWCCVGLVVALVVQALVVGVYYGDWLATVDLEFCIACRGAGTLDSRVLSLRSVVVAVTSLLSMASYCVAVFVAPPGNTVGNSQALWLYVIVNASLLSPRWSQPAVMLTQDSILVAAFMLRTYSNVGMDPLMQSNMYYLEAEVIVFCFLSRLLTDRAARDTFATDLHLICLSEEIAADSAKIEEAIKAMAPEGIAASLIERSRRQREEASAAQRTFWEKGVSEFIDATNTATVLHLFRSTTITTCTRDIAFCIIQLSADGAPVNQSLGYLALTSRFERVMTDILDTITEVQTTYCAKVFETLDRRPTFGVVKVTGDMMMIACAPPFRALGDRTPPDSYDELRCSVVMEFVSALRHRHSLAVATDHGGGSSPWSASLPRANYAQFPPELPLNGSASTKRARNADRGVQLKLFADCQPLLGGILGTSNVTFEYYGGAYFESITALTGLPFGSFAISTRLAEMSDAFHPLTAAAAGLRIEEGKSAAAGACSSLRCKGSRKIFVRYV